MTSRVEDALTALKRGQLVIVADAEDREAEGDLVGVAELVTPDTVNQMVTHARGLLCAPMAPEIAQRLSLLPMLPHSSDAFQTAFTSSLDARSTSTGISAIDRAATIHQLAATTSTWDDFYHPGHLFPLISRANGVLEREGHTEAAVDLARLCGVTPVAYICEILKKNGQMARRKDLKALAEGLKIPFITISEIKAYRVAQTVSPISRVKLPTAYGEFSLQDFENGDEQPDLLLTYGDVTGQKSLLLRVHSECLTGDVFGSQRCDCGAQLQESMRRIAAAGRGAILYLRQEGRVIGLINKLRAYTLQDQGADTVEANEQLGLPADARRYERAAAILHAQGLTRVCLLTNNPDKVKQLSQAGITITQREPLEVGVTRTNRDYLLAKKHKFHHILNEVTDND